MQVAIFCEVQTWEIVTLSLTGLHLNQIFQMLFFTIDANSLQHITTLFITALSVYSSTAAMASFNPNFQFNSTSGMCLANSALQIEMELSDGCITQSSTCSLGRRMAHEISCNACRLFERSMKQYAICV